MKKKTLKPTEKYIKMLGMGTRADIVLNFADNVYNM